MALGVTHAFVTAKTDGSDASLLRPSNWNAGHVITMDTNTLMGKASAGTGPAEAIPVSAATIALLASADLPTFLANLGISPPTTGDGRITLKTTPPATWLMMDDGTFGNAGSGASGPVNLSATAANVANLALFNLLYTFSDALCPVLTSAGGATTRASLGTAAAAWAALAQMTLPKQLGRAIVGAGTGAGLTARALGATFGGDTATLGTANLPAYTPGGTITNGAITMSGTFAVQAGANNNNGGGGGSFSATAGTASPTASQATSTFAGTPQGGSSTAFSIAQASAAWNVMVKL